MNGSDLYVLVDLAKQKLDITWSDKETDESIEEIVLNAISIMKHKLGCSDIDFTAPGLDRHLFLEYVKYSWNDYAHVFDEENRKDIIQARALHGNY